MKYRIASLLFAALLLATANANADEPLAIRSYGFRDHQPDEAVERTTYGPAGNLGRMAFPWPGRTLGFDLGRPARVTRIELTLKKLAPKRAETDTGIETVEVYAGIDDRTYIRSRPAKVVRRLVPDTDPAEEEILIDGDFSGRYFKIAARWEKKYYVFGLDNKAAAIRARGTPPFRFAALSSPMVADENFSFRFTPGETAECAGEVELLLEPGRQTLWRAPAAGLAAGREVEIPLRLESFPAGFYQLELRYREGDAVLSREIRPFRRAPADLRLEPARTDGWESTDVAGPGFHAPALAAMADAAELSYTVPADGDFAVYAAVAGSAAAFRLITPAGEHPFSLALRHPRDGQNPLAGETLAGFLAARAGDTLRLRADRAGARILALRLHPLSPEEKAIAFAAKRLVPAAILHDDGYSSFFFRRYTNGAELAKYIGGFLAGNPFAVDWCVGTTAVNYPSRATSVFGDNPVFYREGDRRAAALIREFHARGEDPVRIVRDTCRRQGVRFSLTLRANACYSADKGSMNSTFYTEHPQFRQKLPNGRERTLFSYAWPEVRAYYLAILDELIAYRPDAVVLEFLRHPPFFGYDPPLVELYRQRHGDCAPADFMNDKWQALQREIMTGFLAELRRRLDAADPAIKLEISFDFERYRAQGLDVEAWLANGWIDLISPGRYHIGVEKYFDLAPFTAMIAKSPRPCLLFPRVESTIQGHDPTPEEEKGLVKIDRKSLSVNMYKALYRRFLESGADGIRPFNLSGSALARALADRAELDRFDRFERPLLDIRLPLFPGSDAP